MPNISEFRQQCAALGLDHIEVIEGAREPDVTLNMIINGQVDTITIGTYEYFESDLKQTDIVFFVEDEVSNQVSFIGNAVFFTERGGSDESWTYKTKKLTIPLNGGVRTFNASIKDEFIASGVLGIMANSIDDVDQYQNYKEDSLYGKIESKIQDLIAEEDKKRASNKGTLIGVKIPWLYNTYVFGSYLISPTGSYDHFLNCAKSNLAAVYSTGDRSRANQSFFPIFLQNKEISINQFSYNFSTVSGDQMHSIDYHIEQSSPNILLKSYIDGQPIAWDHGYARYSNSSYLDLHINGSFDWCLYLFYGGRRIYNCSGGFNTISSEKTYNSDALYSQPILEVYYKEQPFISGMVLWITNIHPDETYPFLGGYITSVALDRTGHIIKPVCPYIGLTDTTIDGVTITNNGKIAYNNCINSTFIADALAQNAIDYAPDSSPFTPLKGKGLMEIAIPMSSTEANYAKNLDYIIAPDEYIPEDYFDDE